MKKFLLCLFLCSTTNLFSQKQEPRVHISSDCSCINLRSDSDFDELISSIVFTVSWPENQKPTWTITDDIPSYRSGYPILQHGRVYQTFVGISLTLLKDIDHKLSFDSDLCIMKFEGADIRLETRGLTTNTDYFVSLNGLEATGLVDCNPCKKESKVVVYPNPSNSAINVLILNGEFDSIKIFNSDGKTVFSDKVNSRNFNISVDNFPNDYYTLRLAGKVPHIEKIIIQR